MPVGIWDQFEAIATARGSDVAVRFGRETLTFSALKAQADRLSQTIPAGPGDRVLLRGENALALICLVPAIWRRGGIVVMVHADAPQRHLDHAIATTDPVAVFCDDPDDTSRPIALASDVASRIEAPMSQPGAAPASVLFTSGSSGMPKGVTQSGANLIDGAARMTRLLGLTPADSILCPIPFAFDYGWGQLLSLLLQGIPLVLPAPRNSFGICQALAEARPTVFAGVPAVFSDLMSGLSPVRDTDCSSVRLLTNTGSKIPAPVFEAICETFPQADIALNYGLTETYRSTSLPLDLARSHPTSVGRAVEGVRLDVVRPDGALAAPGEEGEIVHIGAGTFLGYWNDAERTAQVLRPYPTPDELAVFTGDLGHYDDGGLLYVHGRRDSQLKSMGVRVSPDEVEKILYDSGLLAEVAVTARPNDMLGDMIVACVVAKPGAADGDKVLLKALKKYARSEMSPFMQPREYRLLDALPRTSSGKVAYPALMDMVQGG